MSDRREDIGHEPDVPAVDLSALDPTADARAFDGRVRDILDDARFELARRRRASRTGVAARWGRVAWPAAAAVALASLAVLRTSQPALASDQVTIEEEMALAVGVPEALAVWVSETDAPQISEILVGWEE
ncbi:MAG: hypothetical protein R3195_15030 [Gemmatimonadota bacterium]|nr:hypothetical protein [Gemmatimonadota bacterium]